MIADNLHDASVFPDPTYKETVLRPLFEGAKSHHVEGLRRIDRAHLVMLHETGILTVEQARPIAEALEAIDREVDVGALTYTGEVEDFFFLVEKELRARLGPDLAGRLHTARSRNDIDHTLFKIGLKDRIDPLLERLVRLAETLAAVAERESGTLIVAYTHGQPAQPTVFGHYLSAVLETLLRDIARLEAARDIVDRSPMGAAAITTSGFPIDRELMSHLLGFSRPLENSYGCIASVDYITSTYSAIALVFLHLGRFIQDLQFWTSFEVGQLYVPNAFVQISSIMPQKRNPVPIEHMRHLASQTVGRAQAMLTIMHNTPFTDMNDSEGESQGFGYGAFESGGRVLDLLAALVPALRIDAGRVRQNIRRSCITVTELADSLVRREGLSFREAHEIAAEVSRAVVAVGGDIAADGYEAFQEAFERCTRRRTVIDKALFAEIVSPEAFVAVRNRLGGPAPEALSRAIAGYRQEIAEIRTRMQEAARRAEASARDLQVRFTALLGGR
ncbi:argininosuccinate lyase [Microvirga thermotolerans]|uniref:Argininosuccinate lyase n=1 Tax=Microvirga thermotolerans TaxID=2651334 RepID=A0A5P9JXX9_9HYPH|nr:argininosuccinate lyase [Microvirga thermotolerans]QFU14814.1 argininosuccinate lyase [Microvirga thermotolerans]